MKKLIAFALVLTLVLSLGITSAFAKSDSVVLRFAFSEAPESQTAKIMAHFEQLNNESEAKSEAKNAINTL